MADHDFREALTAWLDGPLPAASNVWVDIDDGWRDWVPENG